MSTIDNIDGIYAKDATLREGIATLRNTVTSQTIKPLTVTQNGTYTADPSEGTYGYSPITVDVQEQPWAPLQDGYSNFWFELTNDTLSPWLNFSAKNNDAVIDWGDGTGEVALDTLTPTHTYAKAGKYVVKVKGVTGISPILSTVGNSKYNPVIKYAELNNEVTTANSFRFCTNLRMVSIASDDTDVASGAFLACSSLYELTFPANTERIAGNNCYFNFSLSKVSIGANVKTIGNTAFGYCYFLRELHIAATIPPTLGTSPFSQMPSDWVCYVPVGTGDTYKSAEGWSAYADHILEEGQTPNRAMLSRLAVSDSSEEDESNER